MALRPVVAVAVCLLAVAGCAAPAAEELPPLPAQLARHQFFPPEVGFLRDLGGLDTPRSEADLVNAGHAACLAVIEDGATRATLTPGLAQWARVDTAGADRMLTAASGNLCRTAPLLDR